MRWFPRRLCAQPEFVKDPEMSSFATRGITPTCKLLRIARQPCREPNDLSEMCTCRRFTIEPGRKGGRPYVSSRPSEARSRRAQRHLFLLHSGIAHAAIASMRLYGGPRPEDFGPALDRRSKTGLSYRALAVNDPNESRFGTLIEGNQANSRMYHSAFRADETGPWVDAPGSGQRISTDFRSDPEPSWSTAPRFAPELCTAHGSRAVTTLATRATRCCSYTLTVDSVPETLRA
jgi:hypothetical protein